MSKDLALVIQHVFVVMPIRNEELLLASTCASLGFGPSAIPPADASLIIVDNNSSDGSMAVAEEIRALSGAAVHIVTEPEIGYVPARRAGIAMVARIADRFGWGWSTVLIVQADADTSYSSGYIDQLRTASDQVGPNHMLVGTGRRPGSYLTQFPRTLALQETADTPLAHLLDRDGEEIVVDDKLAAFRLLDYETWGGHQREFWPDGREMHAETTRLYIRGRGCGARRLNCYQATAVHSTRRLEKWPLGNFVSAGYPGRELIPEPHVQYGQLDAPELEDALLQVPAEAAQRWIQLRQANIVAAFGLLPQHVAGAVGATVGPIDRSQTVLPERSRLEVRVSPATLVSDTFRAVDDPDFVLAEWMR